MKRLLQSLNNLWLSFICFVIGHKWKKYKKYRYKKGETFKCGRCGRRW